MVLLSVGYTDTWGVLLVLGSIALMRHQYGVVLVGRDAMLLLLRTEMGH
jgi:hypothetical protein